MVRNFLLHVMPKKLILMFLSELARLGNGASRKLMNLSSKMNGLLFEYVIDKSWRLSL